jgi:hypothetical protein
MASIAKLKGWGVVTLSSDVTSHQVRAQAYLMTGSAKQSIAPSHRRGFLGMTGGYNFALPLRNRRGGRETRPPHEIVNVPMI